MAHINLGEAQQEGAFNNGAVGQQFTPLCQWPYVWDRVRKQCVLPDDWDWSYVGGMPYGEAERWGVSNSPDLFGYTGPVMGNGGPMSLTPVVIEDGLEGLGANCPEGSGRTAAYTGPEGPDGCRCSPGRIWLNGYCQSPQSVSQQAGSGVYQSYGSMSQEQILAQDLTPAAKNYFAMTKHTVSCKLVTGSPVPGMPNYPTRMCSIDGGAYVHGAYAINTNPETAILSEVRERAAAQVSQQTGTAPGALYQHRSTREAVQSVVQSGQAAQTQAVSEAYNQPPMSVDPGSQGGGIGPGGSGGDPGGGGGGYPGSGGGATDPGIGFPADLGEIPWWVWVAVAGGAYMVMKKK